jgi:phosphate-selective porin
MDMIRNTLLLLLLVMFFAGQVKSQGCASPSTAEGINVFGFLQAQVDYNLYEKPEFNFGFNRSRIGVMGNIPYDFSYYVLLETSPFKKGAPNAYLLDAFITYKRFDFARVSLGSFKSPMSRELNTPCNALHTINRSRAIDELTAPDRDMGIMFLGGGDTTLLQYAVALTNGTGLLKKDGDTFKDLTGRLSAKPVKWLSVGTSYRTGKSKNADPALGNDTRMRFGADFEAKFSGFLIQGEYLYGKDKGSYTIGGGCGSTPETKVGSIERSGMFIMALYHTPWNLQPVVRYENYNDDLSRASNLQQITTFGINYFFNDWTRLQVNYEYAAEKKGVTSSPGTGEVKNDRLMLQLQVKF